MPSDDDDLIFDSAASVRAREEFIESMTNQVDELTAALSELREMFPEALSITVERRCHDFKGRGVVEEWDICVNRLWIGDKNPLVSLSTLSEAMAQVRRWKESQS